MSNAWLATYRASLMVCCSRQAFHASRIPALSAAPHARNGRTAAVAAQCFQLLSRRQLSGSVAFSARQVGHIGSKKRPVDHAVYDPGRRRNLDVIEDDLAAEAEYDASPSPGIGTNKSKASIVKRTARLEAQIPTLHHYTVPDQPYEQAQIDLIFGKDAGVSAKGGNYILDVIHQRRLSGSIAEEGISEPAEGGYWSRPAAAEALQWLRLKHPVDEEATAAQWAEEELKRLEGELYTQKGVSWGLIKRTDDEEAKPSQPAVSPYAGGALEGLTKAIKSQRAEREKKREQEKADEEAQEQERLRVEAKLLRARQRAETKTGRSTRSPRSSEKALSTSNVKGQQVQKHIGPEGLEEWGGYKSESQWSRKYRQEAAATARREPPRMSQLQRLGPSTLLAVAAIAGCFLFSYVYTPPDIRLLPSISTSAATCGTIIALNALVLIAWRYPPFWRGMNKYFVLSPGYPYAASIIGNVFSHQSFAHIGVNMLFVGTGGVLLHEMVGRGDFLALYLGAGVFGSWLSLTGSVLTGALHVSSFGASACVCGIIAGGAILAPDRTWTVRLPFTEQYYQIWTMVLLPVFVLTEVFGLIARRGMLDHWAHLGGYMAGIVGSSLLQWKYTDRAKKAEQLRRDGGIGGNTMWRQDAQPKNDS